MSCIYFFSLELVLLEVVQFSGIPFALCSLQTHMYIQYNGSRMTQCILYLLLLQLLYDIECLGVPSGGKYLIKLELQSLALTERPGHTLIHTRYRECVCVCVCMCVRVRVGVELLTMWSPLGGRI